MGADQIPEQVYLDAARAEATVVSATAIPGDPEWVDGLVEQFARRPEFRAGVESAYRAGQAAAPDGPTTEVQWSVVFADRFVAEVADKAQALAIVADPKYAFAADGPLRRRRVTKYPDGSVLTTPWEVTDATPADGQDGDGHG